MLHFKTNLVTNLDENFRSIYHLNACGGVGWGSRMFPCGPRSTDWVEKIQLLALATSSPSLWPFPKCIIGIRASVVTLGNRRCGHHGNDCLHHCILLNHAEIRDRFVSRDGGREEENARGRWDEKSKPRTEAPCRLQI